MRAANQDSVKQQQLRQITQHTSQRLIDEQQRVPTGSGEARSPQHGILHNQAERRSKPTANSDVSQQSQRNASKIIKVVSFSRENSLDAQQASQVPALQPHSDSSSVRAALQQPDEVRRSEQPEQLTSPVLDLRSQEDGAVARISLPSDNSPISAVNARTPQNHLFRQSQAAEELRSPLATNTQGALDVQKLSQISSVENGESANLSVAGQNPKGRKSSVQPSVPPGEPAARLKSDPAARLKSDPAHLKSDPVRLPKQYYTPATLTKQAATGAPGDQSNAHRDSLNLKTEKSDYLHTEEDKAPGAAQREDAEPLAEQVKQPSMLITSIHQEEQRPDDGAQPRTAQGRPVGEKEELDEDLEEQSSLNDYIEDLRETKHKKPRLYSAQTPGYEQRQQQNLLIPTIRTDDSQLEGDEISFNKPIFGIQQQEQRSF